MLINVGTPSSLPSIQAARQPVSKPTSKLAASQQFGGRRSNFRYWILAFRSRFSAFSLWSSVFVLRLSFLLDWFRRCLNFGFRLSVFSIQLSVSGCWLSAFDLRIDLLFAFRFSVCSFWFFDFSFRRQPAVSHPTTHWTTSQQASQLAASQPASKPARQQQASQTASSQPASQPAASEPASELASQSASQLAR